MFHHLDKYARDDSIVKLLFDHLKNIGVIALVLGAAAWKQKHIEPNWTGLFDIFSGVILGFTGVALMWLNHENLFYKLRGSAACLWVKILAALLYAVIFGQLLKYIQGSHAEKINKSRIVPTLERWNYQLTD